MGRDGLLDAPHPSQQRRWGFIRYADLLKVILLLILTARCGHVGLKGRGQDPLSAREHFTLGSIYEKRGESELALREYKMALNNDSHFLPAMTRLGELSYGMGQYGQAERYYRKAIEMSPRNGDLYNNLSWVYLSQGKRLKEAESLILTAMELTPEHKGYYLDTLGAIYLKQHRYREAIGVLETAVSLFDETQSDLLSQVYRHLGTAYDNIGERSKAEEAFKKAKDALDR
jgi:tetratricopeptide (TPR) repeat protein